MDGNHDDYYMTQIELLTPVLLFIRHSSFVIFNHWLGGGTEITVST